MNTRTTIRKQLIDDFNDENVNEHKIHKEDNVIAVVNIDDNEHIVSTCINKTNEKVKICNRKLDSTATYNSVTPSTIVNQKSKKNASNSFDDFVNVIDLDLFSKQCYQCLSIQKNQNSLLKICPQCIYNLIQYHEVIVAKEKVLECFPILTNEDLDYLPYTIDSNETSLNRNDIIYLYNASDVIRFLEIKYGSLYHMIAKKL